MNSGIEIYFDGACNNEKDSVSAMGIGVVAYKDGEEVHAYDELIDFKGTSNVAEWYGCFCAFKIAFKLSEMYPGVEIYIYSDSQVIVNQYNGKFQINKDSFKGYYEKCWDLTREMGRSFKTLSWIPRTLNQRADELSKVALKKEVATKQSVFTRSQLATLCDFIGSIYLTAEEQTKYFKVLKSIGY